MRNANATGIAAYRNNRVVGSNPQQLVVLLYDHLLARLRRAADQIRAGDIEGRVASLERASDIVAELLSTLDFEAGGEIASRLAALYAYFIGEIGAVARHPDADRLEHMTALVASLHDSWVRAAVGEVVAGAPNAAIHLDSQEDVA
jgi:flagellar protein FliS